MGLGAILKGRLMRPFTRVKLEAKAIWHFLRGVVATPKEIVSSLKSFKKIKGKDERYRANSEKNN